MVHHSPDADSAVAERSEESPTAGTAEGPLDCSRQISATALECNCTSATLRLLNVETGQLVPVANRARNRCPLHAWLACLEDAEMLILDHLEGETPEVTSCFTSRLSRQDLSAFYRAREDVVRALKRNGFPAARYVMRLHYTPGFGTRSGGKRRPHWHGMWKGIPRDRVEEASAIAIPTWCASLNRAASRKAGRDVVVALPEGQYFAAIESADAMLRYVTTHFGKTNQLPPRTFTGHQFTSSRDYFNGATARVARARAKEARARAQVSRRVEAAGIVGHDLVLAVELEMRERSGSQWVLTNDRGVRLTRGAPAPVDIHWRLFAALRQGLTVGGAGVAGYFALRDVAPAAIAAAADAPAEVPARPVRWSRPWLRSVDALVEARDEFEGRREPPRRAVGRLRT